MSLERLLLIGRDYPELGSVCLKSLGSAIGAISAGSDSNSPSFNFKGHKDCPNEDGLVILKEEHHWLFAVADGHLGHFSSHALLDGLAQQAKVPQRLGPLSLTLSGADWLENTAGGTTLLVACCDASTGDVFGLSFGDSSLVTLGPRGALVRNEVNQNFIRGGGLIEVETGRPFQFRLDPEEMMILFTDGVNECCYRDPFRSIRLQHLDHLFSLHGLDTTELTRALMTSALEGVDGNPGGQDNVVIASFRLEQPEPEDV